MQRVVRSTLVGLLTIAGLAACGDKITVPPAVTTTPVQPVVRSVTVSPPSAILSIGDKFTFAASVNADAGITDRTVTWSSSNTAIADVDANGLVTAKATGTASIIAKSKIDASVQGAASVTVNPGPGAGAPATVTVSTINQTVCSAITGQCSSVPANLGNVVGQIDVTLNVDPGAARLVGVDLVMNCTGNGNSGQDTVVATQTLASSNVAPEASASTAPVTLSFNTATFNATTGAVAVRNGTCALKGRARTNLVAGGAITTTTSTSSTITVNNNDVVIGSVASTKSAIDPNANPILALPAGVLWQGGTITVTATPVMFSGRVPATATITFECRTVTVTGAGTKTAQFVDNNDAAAPPCGGATPAGGNAAPASNDIDNVTDAAAAATFTLIDAAGQPFTTNPCGAGNLCTAASYLANPNAPVAVAAIRLDTQAPTPGNFPLASNADQGTSANGYVGSNFRFVADSAAGFRGPNAVAGNQTRNLDNGGVDAVTVQFQSATSVTGTFAPLTNTTGLAETNTATGRTLIQITTDLLGNADTSFVTPAGVPQAFRVGLAAQAVPNNFTRFGVDLSPPTVTTTANSTPDLTAVNTIQNTSYQFAITDNLSGTGNLLVAQTRNYNSNSTAVDVNPAVIEGTISTNACGTNGLAAAVAVTVPGACITPATAVDRAGQASTDPCVVGRFNAAASAAGANALTVFDRTGAALGFCTPVVYLGTTDVGVNAPAATGVAAAQVSGYYSTIVIATDQAGNRAAPFRATVYQENTAPVINNIDLPGSITGNSTASFPASVTEGGSGSQFAGDITASWALLEYSTVTNAGTANAGGGTNVWFRYPNIPGPGTAFDNVITRTATATPTIANFAKSLTISTAQAGNPGSFTPVTASGNNVDTVAVQAQDPAIVPATGAPNAGAALKAKLAPSVQLLAGSTSSFSGQFTGGFRDSLSTANVSVCAGGCTAANPTSVTIFAIAQGNTGLFNNPFAGSSVTFWYRPAGRDQNASWFFISSVTSGVTQDTGAGVGRSWIYSTTWTPPAVAPDGTKLAQAAGSTTQVQVRAVGVNTNGDAVGTLGTTLVTLTNP